MGWCARTSFPALVVAAALLGACAGDDGTTTLRPGQSASTSESSPSPTSTARPSPPADSPVLIRIAAIGDFGAATDAQFAIARRMCRWRNRHPFGLVFTTGDNVYDYGDPDEFEEKFFEPYRCLLENGVRFHAALGNHDVQTDNGRPELEEPAFGMPRRNYVIRHRGVRFVVADSTDLDPAWLRRATVAQDGDEWTLVFFHHPVYSVGDHGSTPGYRPALPRMFRNRDVDLVLNGHDHLYSVTRPLRRIRYLVTGGGGAPLYACGDAWFVATCKSRHHFTYVVVRADRVVVHAVPAVGPRIHRFETAGRT